MRIALVVASVAALSTLSPQAGAHGFGLAGTTVLGGSAGLSANSDDIATDGVFGDDETSVSSARVRFGPLIGHFVTDGFLLAGALTLEAEGEEDYSGDTIVSRNTNTVGLHVIPSYYFGLGSSFMPYLRAQLGVVSVSSESQWDFGDTVEISGSGVVYGLGGGLTIPVGVATGGFLQLGLDLVWSKLSLEVVDSELEQRRDRFTFEIGTALGLFF